MKRFAIVVGTAVLGLTGLTACAADEPAKDTPSASKSAPAESSEVTLATSDVGNFGEIVVDGEGRTLYVFTKDTVDPPKSNCDGDCAAMWPPVEAPAGEPQLDGVDASLVGTVERSDGSQQLTLKGWPLYEFAKDTKAGEAKGQAVGGVWWVVGADGKKITKQAAPETGTGTGGY